MDFHKLMSTVAHAGGAVVHGAEGIGRTMTGAEAPTDPVKAAAALKEMQDKAGAEIQSLTPPEYTKPFQLPPLDASLSASGIKAKKKFEADNPGQEYTPTEDDYTDAGPNGYLHKKAIHGAWTDYQNELEQNMKEHKIDYAGIMKQKLADLASMPKEHRANPLVMFGIAMGNPEHAAELVKNYTGNNDAENHKLLAHWQDLLQIKSDAIKGSISQAMAAGDYRKVASGKWLDELKDIADKQAKFEEQKQLLGQKGEQQQNAINTRGKWAKEVMQSRVSGMLSAAGIKAGSDEWKGAQSDASRQIDTLVAHGMSHEDAFNEVMDRMHTEWDKRALATHGGIIKPPVVTGGGNVETNPLEAAAARRRAGKH